jgi:hypothetical protein
MAYDPVTNRLFVASEDEVSGDSVITAVNLNGSGASFFSAPGMVVDEPEGIVLDPASRMMYWINTGNATIGWAKLDGSAAGTLDTTGAPIENSYRIAIDPASGRLYWPAQSGGKRVVSWANVNNTGGGILPTELGAISPDGIAINAVTRRLYLISGSGSTGVLTSLSVDGGPVESLPVTVGFHESYGLAVDPTLARAYWGNYGLTDSQTEAIGFSGLSGSPAGFISMASTHVNGAQDPVILKSPTGTAAPTVSQSAAALTCSQGSWSQDYPGGFIYTAPTGYSYQWLLNGAAVVGATSSAYTATTSGSYACTVTGTNPTGSASQTSVAATVTPATLSLKLNTKTTKAKAGKAATVKFKVANSGDLTSAPLKVCAKLNKKAKKGLKAPKCASVDALAFGGSAMATLKVKTKPAAKGTYKFSAQLKGATAKSITVTVKVTAAKPKKKH